MQDMKLMNTRRVIIGLPFFFLILFIMLSATADAQIKKNVFAPAYLIGPGDHLHISVWKEDDMQLDVLVTPDGGISFPLAGEIHASGLTTEQLRQVLVKKLKRYIPQPVITVSVIQSVSNKVYVIGKVARPGEFIATGYLDVLQALSLAGGVTPYASADEIKIIRRTSKGNKVFNFDYDEVVDGNQLNTNILLKAGDTVVVP